MFTPGSSLQQQTSVLLNVTEMLQALHVDMPHVIATCHIPVLNEGRVSLQVVLVSQQRDSKARHYVIESNGGCSTKLALN